MIEIKINTHENPNDTLAPCRRRSQSEIFIEGFKKLCEATNIKDLTKLSMSTYDIPLRLNFNDGTAIGMAVLFNEAGFHLKTDK